MSSHFLFFTNIEERKHLHCGHLVLRHLSLLKLHPLPATSLTTEIKHNIITDNAQASMVWRLQTLISYPPQQIYHVYIYELSRRSGMFSDITTIYPDGTLCTGTSGEGDVSGSFDSQTS